MKVIILDNCPDFTIYTEKKIITSKDMTFKQALDELDRLRISKNDICIYNKKWNVFIYNSRTRKGEEKLKENEELVKMSLKAARVNKGLTQQQTSEKSGIGIDRIRRAEKGVDDNTLKIVEICKLCEIYGVGLSDIKF